VHDARLFDITCAGRDDHRWGDKYKTNRDTLSPPQRLIHDLCVKADGNLLWVTCVLDTVSQRLADGQSVAEVMRYILDLPRDLEDYYYNLVYTRIHSTYRTGKVSECAMALKIVACVVEYPGSPMTRAKQRLELIRALQTSINTRSGVAYDSEFFTKTPSPETSRPLDKAAYQSVCAFVRSRCKDLMLTSKGRDEGCLHYQHRIIYDFVLSKRLQLLLDASVPEHFRQPHFSFQLGLLPAGQLHERSVHKVKSGLREFPGLTGGSDWVLLDYYFMIYLRGIQGPLHQRAVQMCAKLTESIIKLRQLDGSNPGDFSMLPLILDLARTQQFTPMSQIIRLESTRSSNHTILKYANKEEAPYQSGPGEEHSPIRQVVSTSESHTRLVDPVLGPVGAHYLPCASTWWTKFLHFTKDIDLEDDIGSVWSESRAATYMARAFLESGASVDIELCVAEPDCRQVRICLDFTLHSRMDECPEPSPEFGENMDHKHRWLSAKNILSDRFGIPEAELLQFQAKNRNTRNVSETDVLKLAQDDEVT
jgi:hypothetical protein